MKIINFLYIAIYDWFYRDGKPRHPRSIEKSEERAGYVLAIGFVSWAILFDAIRSYSLEGFFKVHISIYLIAGFGLILSYVLDNFYVKPQKFKYIYVDYKNKYGSNRLKYQLFALGIVVGIPFLSAFLIVLVSKYS